MDFITPGAKQYKANLHCHSKLSDGALTPGELVSAYKNNGYSVLAITDHEAPYDHTALSDKDFLLLTGYEAYIRESPVCVLDPLGPEIHLNLFAKDAHNTAFVAFDPNYCKYMPADVAASRRKVGDIGPRRYSREYIQSFINEANANGYLVSYNHPCWSMENPDDILSYTGLFSLEVFNTGSMTINAFESNMALYDMMLRRGRKIYCHGADDNHNKKPFGDPLCDSFGSWTMLLCESLSYASVMDALENGRFYASTGPTVRCLRFDGNRVHMEFDGAVRAIMHISPKRCVNVYSRDGSAINEADFTIPDWAPYVYFTVIDEKGREAQIHGFTRDELGI